MQRQQAVQTMHGNVNFIEEGRGERGRSICVGAIGPLVLLWLRHGC